MTFVMIKHGLHRKGYTQYGVKIAQSLQALKPLFIIGPYCVYKSLQLDSVDTALHGSYMVEFIRR